MLSGGEESCRGRRSRGTETGAPLPGYDPSRGTTRQENQEHGGNVRPASTADKGVDHHKGSARQQRREGDQHSEQPKVPASAYQNFVISTRPEIKGSVTEVARELYRRWAAMGTKDKAVWENAAKAEKALYDENMKRWTTGQQLAASEHDRMTAHARIEQPVRIESEGSVSD